ncbi:MAG: transposase [Bacillota bacterium]|nr:transposase [Bacillota bacterium]
MYHRPSIRFQFDVFPAEVKDEYDSTTLIPSLELFFTKQSYEHIDFFLADSGFDGYDNYKYISKKNIIPIIPLNQRNNCSKCQTYNYSQDNEKNNFFFNSEGNLICRKTNLPMKSLGPIRSDKRADRFSYGCPLIKTHALNGEIIYADDCNHPCSDAIYGRKVNIAIDEEYRHLDKPLQKENCMRTFHCSIKGLDKYKRIPI